MATAANTRKSDRLFSTSRSATSASSLCVSIGSELDVVLDDRRIKSNPQENKNRRTIVVKRENESFGFTLQSYGLRRVGSNKTDLLSYVDYVELGGPAYKAGMRQGDVILSVNGKSMENVDHESLVDAINCCEDSIRMVVLFEDVCRKIELHLRYYKLKQILETKKVELLSLSEQEAGILKKFGAHSGDSINVSESTETSSVFGSFYFGCGGTKLDDGNTSSSSVFQSTSDICQVLDSAGVTSLDLCSSGIYYGSKNSIDSPQTETRHDILPSYGDEFWNSDFGYKSLPIRSKKQVTKSAAVVRTASVRRNVANHRFVGSVLHEESDGPNNFSPTSDSRVENTDLPVLYPANSSKEISSTANFVSPKLKDKRSTSVANLIKLKIQNSPFMPRRLFPVQTNARQNLTRNRETDLQVPIVRDPRNMTKQLRQEISNYVITEDLGRRPDDPQLLGLQQLCDDFRYICIQESLKQRRKSIELKISFDPNSRETQRKMAAFQPSKPYGSVGNRSAKMLTDLDRGRHLHELSCGENESAEKISKLVNVDPKGRCDQRQQLPEYMSDSSHRTMGSCVKEVEAVDGCRNPMTPGKSRHKKMVSWAEVSTEFPLACNMDQGVNTADEVTRL